MNSEAKETAKMILETQQCDGVTMAVCKEMGAVSFGKDPLKARKNLLGTILSNATIILAKQERNEPLVLKEEKRIAPKARIISDTFTQQGDISSLFEFKPL